MVVHTEAELLAQVLNSTFVSSQVAAMLSSQVNKLFLFLCPEKKHVLVCCLVKKLLLVSFWLLSCCQQLGGFRYVVIAGG